MIHFPPESKTCDHSANKPIVPEHCRQTPPTFRNSLSSIYIYVLIVKCLTVLSKKSCCRWNCSSGMNKVLFDCIVLCSCSELSDPNTTKQIEDDETRVVGWSSDQHLFRIRGAKNFAFEGADGEVDPISREINGAAASLCSLSLSQTDRPLPSTCPSCTCVPTRPPCPGRSRRATSSSASPSCNRYVHRFFFTPIKVKVQSEKIQYKTNERGVSHGWTRSWICSAGGLGSVKWCCSTGDKFWSRGYVLSGQVSVSEWTDKGF